MPKNDLEQVRAVLEGIATGDQKLATQFVRVGGYLEHDPELPGDVEGLREFLRRRAAEASDFEVVRLFRDGDHAVAHSRGNVQGRANFFDVFRLQDEEIVEHWRFSAPPAPLKNNSGHSPWDGPTEPDGTHDTDRTKAIVRDYYETVHLSGQYHQIPRFFFDDYCVRHEPGVTDGVIAFKRDLETLTSNRTIDEIKIFIGDGDLVFLVAEGTHAGTPCAYVDLYRVKDDKLVEHWGFPQEMQTAVRAARTPLRTTLGGRVPR